MSTKAEWDLAGQAINARLWQHQAELPIRRRLFTACRFGGHGDCQVVAPTKRETAICSCDCGHPRPYYRPARAAA